MKSSRWIIPAVIALGLLAGAAIVGRPAATSELRLPLDAGTTTSTTAATTTTTTLPDPATVRVVVGNASTRNGLATDAATELTEAGYVDVIATNAVNDSADSYIVFRDGFQGAATAVAELLGIPTERVLPYIDADVTERDADGDVLVVVGADRA